MISITFRIVATRRALIQTASIVMLTGCVVGPDFKAPAAPTDLNILSASLPEKTVSADVAGGEAQAFVKGRALPERWWTLFESAPLNAIVEEALSSSPTVASAQAALRTAEANHRAQVSTLFPRADADVTAERQKIDPGSFGNPGRGAVIYNLYNASVGVSYQLDLWGGAQRGVEASAAAADARACELEAVYQTLIANVVTTAVEIARTRFMVQGAHWLIDDQTKRLEITKKQFAAGAVSRHDLFDRETELANDQAMLPAAEATLHAARAQLAVYLNKTPGDPLPDDLDLFTLKLPPEIPVSLPSEIVRQRPDIRASEAELHQAAANVGVATANLLPQIALTASTGTQATTLDQLFTNNIFSIGGALTQPLFRAGELTARRRAAVASFDRASADYRKTVVLAFQNVANSLQAIEADSRVLVANDQLASTAEGMYNLTVSRRRLGTASLLEELQAHSVWTRARAGYGFTVGTRLQDSAALFHAIGGTWSRSLAKRQGADIGPLVDAR